MTSGRSPPWPMLWGRPRAGQQPTCRPECAIRLGLHILWQPAKYAGSRCLARDVIELPPQLIGHGPYLQVAASGTNSHAYVAGQYEYLRTRCLLKVFATVQDLVVGVG